MGAFVGEEVGVWVVGNLVGVKDGFAVGIAVGGAEGKEEGVTVGVNVTAAHCHKVKKLLKYA